MHQLKIWITATLCIALIGCSAAPQRPAASRFSEAMDAGLAWLSANNPQKAGESLSAAASAGSLSASEQSELLALAALAFQEAGSIPLATQALDRARLTQGAEPSALLALAMAASVGGKDPDAAVRSMPQSASAFPEPFRARALALMSAIAHQAGQTINAAEYLFERAGYLPAETQEAERKRAIALLSDVPVSALAERMPPVPDDFGGWLEWAYITRVYQGNPQRLNRELALWKERYPDHAPAATGPETTTSVVLLPPLQKIVALLPLSGSLSAAGNAIQGGLLQALYQSSEPIEIVFIDTGGLNATTITGALLQAQKLEPDLIIGPLTKENVGAVLDSAVLNTPLLALNSSEEMRFDGDRFSFSMLPEHEALSVAEFARRQGLQNALALLPNDRTGQRLAHTFRSAWIAHGGRHLETQFYATDTHDFSSAIVALFDLDESDARIAATKAATGLPLHSQERRRSDADFLFLDADVLQARLLLPQLQFHELDQLPVMATSSIYSGQADPRRDRDLTDIRFNDATWLLDGGTAEFGLLEWYQHAELVRLHLFGHDALRAAQHLNVLQQKESFEGALGRISMGDGHQLVRHPSWARFTDTGIELIAAEAPAPNPDVDSPDAAF